MTQTSTPAAKLSEISPGEMREVSIGKTKVLLARVGETCHAVGANCTHYGAPLVEGALVGDRIICPWHHACFNARSGRMEEPPALDSLPLFPVRVDGDDIYIDVPADAPDRCAPVMSAADVEKDPRVFVIIGGGAAGYMAAQTLREDGFTGRIVMITSEERLPYDRPNLSKDYLQGQAEPEWMPLRPDEFYSDHHIEIVRGRTVAEVRPQEKQVVLSSGEKLNYDLLLIATGGTPRELALPGSDIDSIFVLRSFDSADEILKHIASGRRAVVVGSSFIGMEAAASLRKQGVEVTVISPDKMPFEKTLGPEIGGFFRKVHEENGVQFRLGANVSGFEKTADGLAVIVDGGDRSAADLALVGIGVKPTTDFLRSVELHKDGGVIADEYLRIADGIYAAGDIVHFPDQHTGDTSRIEHWRTAQQQGRAAAFWTTQFDATLNYVGHATRWDETVINGSLEAKEFLAFYISDGRVSAVAGMGKDKELAIIEGLMTANRMPDVHDLRRDDITNILETLLPR
jgi:NADPH-dependent 2,4-dienoyl-CoA reductase/sulfur reductase-like enzyme/nitrite reductase/ring-hydroxylating ferredoxin subunit